MIIEALTWQVATIASIRRESPRTKSYVLTTESPYPFIPGQHLIARVSFPGGFKTARGYSMTSAPTSGTLELAIARAEGGEVSGWFDSASVGDSLEITQAIGKEFLWIPTLTDQTLFIAGGIGIAPFMSMLREKKLTESDAPLRLLYCAQNYDDLCFKEELFDPAYRDDFSFMLSRESPLGWKGLQGRITKEVLASFVPHTDRFYICGPYQFVGTVKRLLQDKFAIHLSHIHVEKFN